MTATQAATLTVTIPLTNDDCLGLNHRCSRHETAKQTLMLRAAAKLATTNALVEDPLGDVWRASGASRTFSLHWTIFLAKSRKRHDADNMVSKLKPAMDGICDALGIDDNRIVLRGVVQALMTGRQSDAVAELTVEGDDE